MQPDPQTSGWESLVLNQPFHRRPAKPRIFLFGWLLYLGFSPIFVFRSGYPQPADIMLAILIGLLLTGYLTRAFVHQTLYTFAFFFLGWVAVVNWFWYAQYQDARFLLSSVYYAYNFCVVMLVITLMKDFGQSFLSWTRVGLLAGLGLELAVVLFVPDLRGVRHTGTFNNPNQLGYWCLLTGACWLSLKADPGAAGNGARLTLVDLAAFYALGLIAAHTLSKAAMISVVMLFIFGVYFQGMGWRLKIPAALGVAVGVLTLFVGGMNFTPSLESDSLIDRVVARFESIGGQEDDSAAGRGYDRIWLHPEYLLFGAGEGAMDRFTTGKVHGDALQRGGEMHSTFGTVLFSYGIVGLGLFFGFLWFVFRRAHWRHLAYFAPICAYGLTHQGLRDSLLWVFLGLVFGRAYIQRAGSQGSGAREPVLAQRVPTTGASRLLLGEESREEKSIGRRTEQVRRPG